MSMILFSSTKPFMGERTNTNTIYIHRRYFYFNKSGEAQLISYFIIPSIHIHIENLHLDQPKSLHTLTTLALRGLGIQSQLILSWVASFFYCNWTVDLWKNLVVIDDFDYCSICLADYY
jgi:hypothetical protein